MLNPQALIDAAKKQTNLDNLGNPIFLEGFYNLVDSINKEADLNEIGMQAQHHRLIGILANMLRIEQALIL
ncbi:MAG: sulfotransferase, partial [SAR86 cluster bacterium]|nr:sulfotransferase [SAR86 cluster bacterium]